MGGGVRCQAAHDASPAVPPAVSRMHLHPQVRKLLPAPLCPSDAHANTPAYPFGAAGMRVAEEGIAPSLPLHGRVCHGMRLNLALTQSPYPSSGIPAVENAPPPTAAFRLAHSLRDAECGR
jgi:hypothetical protein